MDISDPIDMDIPRTFFGPHPGFAGAAIPIPEPIRKVAEELDGETMSLHEAVAKLEAVGIGSIKVRHGGILLFLDGGASHARHMFRIISY